MIFVEMKNHIAAGTVVLLRTGIKIEIDWLETGEEFDPPIRRVKSRFDLFAQDVKNRVIVGTQHERCPDYYRRFLHYHCAALLEQTMPMTTTRR